MVMLHVIELLMVTVTGGQIPDANMIHLVRKRRQMAREMVDDFIAVDDTVRYENKSSRLIRWFPLF